LRRLCAPLSEDADVGVAESVDRLELVADEEHLRTSGVRDAAVFPLGDGGFAAVASNPPPQEVDEVALQAVRVLELGDHDRPEAQPLPLADLRVVSQQVARVELEILEVECRLAR